MSTVDHYKVLGVKRDAPIEEIKKRFIELSKVKVFAIIQGEPTNLY